MSKPAATPIPEGFHTVTPHLVCKGGNAALEFYQRAFGAVVLDRIPTPDGALMHAVMRIGDSILMLVDEFSERGTVSPLSLKGTPVMLHLFVPDVDAVVSRAAAAGAKVAMPPTDMFWGDRYGSVLDPFGHHWSVATHKFDLTPEEIAEAAKSAAGC